MVDEAPTGRISRPGNNTRCSTMVLTSHKGNMDMDLLLHTQKSYTKVIAINQIMRRGKPGNGNKSLLIKKVSANCLFIKLQAKRRSKAQTLSSQFTTH